MLLTIDIGNSNIVIVIYDGQKKRLYDARYVTLKDDPTKNYEVWIRENLVPLKTTYQIDDFILSSVVPSVTQVFFELIQKLLGLDGLNCGLEHVREFVVKLKNPEELGADFMATSYGALAHTTCPVIIADMGSATKISALDVKGAFAGGIIMPGLKVSQDALNAFIPHLPHIPMEVPESVLGSDTITAMQAGMMYSNIEAIRGISNRIEAEFNVKCGRILTGGLSNLVHQALPEFDFEPYLLNDGLFEIYHLNRS